MFSKKSPYVKLAILRLIQQNKFLKITPTNLLTINNNKKRQYNAYISGKRIFDARDILLEIFKVGKKAHKKGITI